MKTVKFLRNSSTCLKQALFIMGCVACGSALANADSLNSPDTLGKPAELVLTLSNGWLPSETSQFPNVQKSVQQGDAIYVENTGKQKTPKPINVGCDVDIEQNTNASISNRLEGNCNLNYHY